MSFPPDSARWAPALVTRAKAISAPIYQPFDHVARRLAEDPLFRAAVDRPVPPGDLARRIQFSPAWLLEAITAQHAGRLVAASAPNPLVDDVVAADLFVLLRSALLLVDLEKPSYAGTTAVAFHAHQLGIPVWGVSDRIVTSPWFLAHAEGVVRPAAIPDLLYDLLALTPPGR